MLFYRSPSSPVVVPTPRLTRSLPEPTLKHRSIKEDLFRHPSLSIPNLTRGVMMEMMMEMMTRTRTVLSMMLITMVRRTIWFSKIRYKHSTRQELLKNGRRDGRAGLDEWRGSD
jgi:hypothetical protein